VNTEERFCDTGHGIRICYQIAGPVDAPRVALIAGLGYDLYSWPEQLIDGLRAAGLRVLVFDNRDAGRSSRALTPPPTKRQQLLRRPPAGNYDLDDMAGDTIALLDHLEMASVHLVGMSLGGMIAQCIASLHPERVRSLTSIFSTTGDRRVGQPARSTMLRFAKPQSTSARSNARRHVAMLRHIGSRVYPYELDWETAWAIRSWERGDGTSIGAGAARQIAAIHKSADRTSSLRRVVAPTLVIHGDRDRMVHPTGGLATAGAIPGAEHVTIPGMRHHLSPGVSPRLVQLITGHIGAAERRLELR